MTAESMEERIEEFARLAQNRAQQQDKDLEEVVHDLTHESYLMKHTTEDVLKELGDLVDTYPDAFYNGAANDHLMQYLDNTQDFEFWYDYLYLSLAAGLEWAILDKVNQAKQI